MTISYEDISRRAYELWEKNGQPAGKEQEHWFQAETELRNEQLKSLKGKRISSQDPTMLKTPKASLR